MSARVSVDDLGIAADWLDSYEDAPDEDNGDRCRRVAAWIRAEIERREEDALVRKVATTHGVSPARARAAVRRRAQ